MDQVAEPPEHESPPAQERVDIAEERLAAVDLVELDLEFQASDRPQAALAPCKTPSSEPCVSSFMTSIAPMPAGPAHSSSVVSSIVVVPTGSAQASSGRWRSVSASGG